MESIGESKTTTAAAIASTGTHGISKDGQSENIFGHSMRRHFRIAESYFNLNHGSFGCVPKVVSEAQVGFIATCESRPDKWFRQTYFKHVKNSRRKIAKLINADQADVVLVEGASSSMNGVLRSFPFKSGDRVLVLSNSYPMVLEALDWLIHTKGIQIIKVPIHFPIVSDKQILEDTARAVASIKSEGHKIALSVFSHVGSMPSFVEPVAALTRIVKEAGSLVYIDGAHAPGTIDIDVMDIGADFYSGNLHKWLFTPKSAAFLWVRRELQTDTFPEPTVISSSKKRDFVGRYEYTGTRDYSAFCSIPSALHFVEKELGGLQRVRAYNRQLLGDAIRMLADVWGTRILVPLELLGFMGNVELPSRDRQAVVYMQKQLQQEHDMFIACDGLVDSSGDTIFFARLSAQIYLDMTDFDELAALVPRLLAEWSAREVNKTSNACEHTNMRGNGLRLDPTLNYYVTHFPGVHKKKYDHPERFRRVAE